MKVITSRDDGAFSQAHRMDIRQCFNPATTPTSRAKKLKEPHNPHRNTIYHPDYCGTRHLTKSRDELPSRPRQHHRDHLTFP